MFMVIETGQRVKEREKRLVVTIVWPKHKTNDVKYVIFICIKSNQWRRIITSGIHLRYVRIIYL